ncbi:unnamed protein product [Miscanthus lutarioriparius]|uniref:Uncharacterized protein n=1 Tax=Miscanthus lutarioriparius TaxID=422564 RepID=A0A811Q9U0_9POAL|nr:unnamed protein product [Miscanthus lutarioriparius]
MVVKVDLECERCNKKIRRSSTRSKRNLVTISGPFDAEKVRRKLCCEAGRIIKGMDVKAPEETKDGGMEKEEHGRKTAAAPAVNLRPLLEKMLERPKARTQPAPAPAAAASRPRSRQQRRSSCPRRPAPSLAMAKAPSLYYGVRAGVQHRGVVIMRRRRAAAALPPPAAAAVLRGGPPTAMAMGHGQ